MDAMQMSAALSGILANDHWGVTGPFRDREHIHGPHMRVWLNNGFGVVLRDNHSGGVDALMVQHVERADEDKWTAFGPGWEYNVNIEQVEVMLRSLMSRPGRMAPRDHAHH